MNRRLMCGFAILLSVSMTGTYGQTVPFLERTMTISFNEERLDDVLNRISKEGGFIFSYSPSIIDREQIVTRAFIGKSVRQILDDLFGGRIQYRARGAYIILTKSDATSSQQSQVLTGYVVDEATGERLKNVSIYDPITLSSTVTDSYGFFELKVDQPPRDLRLAINKQQYVDTLVVVPSGNGRLLNIPIKFNKDRFSAVADSVGSKIKRFWKNARIFSRQQVNLANIDDTLYRKGQVSFIPFVGTNRGLSGHVVNDYSFNIIGGYSRGVRRMEIGGVFNVVREDVEGVQLGGVANVTGGKTAGVQVAGIVNSNGGSVRGAQFAGIGNLDLDSVSGFAAGGIFNVAGGHSKAMQFGGILNVAAGDQEQPQIAGVLNIARRSAVPQLGGVINLVGHNGRGIQLAGVLNVAGRNFSGLQLAGVANLAGAEVNGCQISGVLNYGKTVHGTQIGLFNVADSVRGLSLGLLSIVMKGYHKFEISSDEIFYANVAFRTGVNSFYNIITVGAKPYTFKAPETFWTFGYGIGTAPRLSRTVSLNLDVTSNQIMQGNDILDINLLNKLYLGVDIQVLPKLSITAGGTLNGYLTRIGRDDYWNVFDRYQPDFVYQTNFSNETNLKMWLGGKVGIRFL